jgi:hypothetical protein
MYYKRTKRQQREKNGGGGAGVEGVKGGAEGDFACYEVAKWSVDPHFGVRVER